MVYFHPNIDDKVKMEAHVFNLNNKSHAIHLHEFADCSSDDGKSTGGHWNPTFEKHGKWGDEAYVLMQKVI